MRRMVVDAPTVLAWFDVDGPGAEMRREYEAGAFTALAPRRIHEDLLAGVAERRQTTAEQLARIAAELPHLGIVVQDPPLPLVAGWLARGLDAQTAPYAALAESLDLRLATTDPRLARTAAALVSP